MQKKLNDEFIREYSEEFSENVINSFFNQKSTITGKEILNLTPSRQVNLFVIKILFRKWQEEMKRLESPYFNYKNPDVKKAMVQFMNTLSQYIEVEAEPMQLMLAEAVADTLLLLADPAGYFQLEFEEMDVEVVTEKLSKPLLKYLKVYKQDLESIFEEVNGEVPEEVVEVLEEHFAEQDISMVIKTELDLLSKILEVSEEDLYAADDEDDFPGFEDELGSAPAPAYRDDEEAGNGFFDEALEEEEPEPAPAPVRYPKPEIKPEVKPEPPRFVREPEPYVEEEIEEEPEDEMDSDFEDDHEHIDEPPLSIPVRGEIQPDPDDNSLNARFSAPPSSTINDSFGNEADTLADQLEKRKVSSIMDGISVNHRYMFTKELFDGDRDAFVTAIDDLESATSFDSAVEILVQNYARKREWDMNSEEVKELLKVVFRRFR